MAYDVVIRNGRVVDGSGFGAYRADVGIADGEATGARPGRLVRSR
jgi:N-acyl-D-aspartate/D-glutamate deacylase